MRYYVETYDKNDLPILGNLDGQRSWEGRDFRRTRWYKELPKLRVSNRVAYWKIVDASGRCLCRVHPAIKIPA